MTIEYLKKADLTSSSNADDVSQTVKDILNKIEAGGDEVALAYAKQFDKYQGNICLLYTSPSPRDRTRSRMPSSA